MSSGLPIAFVVRVGEEYENIRLPIDGPSFSIGRDPDNRLSLADDRTASRHHCTIRVVGHELMVEDLKSTNGTFVDGKRIDTAAALHPPCMLMVGNTQLAIVANPELQAEEVEAALASMYSAQNSIIIPPSTLYFRNRLRTEAFLVVDLVDSTGMVRGDADDKFAKFMFLLGHMIRRDLRGDPDTFLKGTGDGFFACFPTAEAALRTAEKLGPGFAKQVDRPVQLSVALHWGTAILADDGDRTGKHVHGVFSLEKVRHENAEIEASFRTRVISDVVLMTHDFRAELSPDQQPRALLCGSYQLKGFDENVRVYRWMGQGAQVSSGGSTPLGVTPPPDARTVG